LSRCAPLAVIRNEMSSVIVAPSAFSSSKVTFSPVKILESGGKQAYLNYDSRPLVMQVGSLETPFGLSVYDKTTPVKYTVDLKLRGYDDATNSPTAATIYKAMNALDEYMVDQGVANSKAWFKANLTRDVVKAFYTPTVRFAKDADGNVKPYPPTLKVQLRQRDGKFDAQVYDDKKRPLNDVPLEDILVKGAFLTVLIQCTGVWFAGSKYGLSWKAIQIRADKVPESIRGFAFLDDGESAPAPTASVAKKVAPTPAAASTNQFANLDDEDEVDDEEALAAPAVQAAPAAEEEEEADEEDVPPIPVPAKKTVMTKKKIVTASKK
jgi:Family of unknown function (DUF5871)